MESPYKKEKEEKQPMRLMKGKPELPLQRQYGHVAEHDHGDGGAMVILAIRLQQRQGMILSHRGGLAEEGYSFFCIILRDALIAKHQTSALS